jgi:type I restriction-modification system DNA methylase subunit
MKEQFFAKLETLIAEARRLTTRGFDEQEPEAATCHELILPLLAALGFLKENIKPEFKILGDSVDYLLKSERPLMFVETKSLLDCFDKNLFDKHREQVHRYIQNYRLSPEITAMAQPVKWILLTNFAQLHFIRVNEVTASFSFKLDDLWPRREELWELLALENLEANRIDEVYDQHKKAGLDQQFLADLKRWRLLIANGFALRNKNAKLDDITLASQQLLDRFIFCRMLETQRLVEYNKLARTYSNYEVLYARADKTFGEILRESLFVEIKNDFNTELFEQPLLCDQLAIDNIVLSAVIGHEPLAPELAAHCGFESGQGELLAFRHLYRYDFSLMSSDVMGAVYERFLAHKLLQDGGRVVIEDTDELRKKEGIYYTPQYIVDYIVAHTLGEKIQPILAEAKTLLGCKNFKDALAKIRELGEIKVLDPAMGSGSFLLRAFDALVRAYDDYNQECRRIKKERNGHGALFDADLVIAEEVLEAPLHVLTENIFGVDLDKQAVEVAKLNLWLRYMAMNRDPFIERLRQKPRGGKPLSLLPNLTHNLKRGNSLIADKSVAGDTAFDWQQEFPETMKRGGFDVVIGNPPYERIQVMQANAPEAAEFLKANYRAAASGNFDIYVCFIERGLELLNANGFFGYICPHKFFQAEYGEPLRKLLSEGKHVRHIVSFGDQQIFPKISTYTCLLHLAKGGCEAMDYADAEVEQFAAKHETLPSFKVAASSLSSAPWNFLSATTTKWMEKAAAAGKLLGELTKEVFVGLQTSADDVFLFETAAPRKNVCKVFSESLQKEIELESALLKPVIRSGQIGRGWAQPTHFVLFPYKLAKGKAELLAEKELVKQFPLVWDYLKKNEQQLRAREHGKFAEKGWWQLYPKNLELWETPKILAPYMIQELSAYYDEGSNYFVNVTTGGFGLRFDSPKMDKFVTGLLNSSLLDAYLKQVSTNFRGGYFAANKQFLDKLPIKLIDPKNKGEVKLENEVVECVEQIQAAHRQRMKLPEVLQRLIAHNQNRTSCNLAHYLQKDFAAVKADILIDDVQRTGFVHEIRLESNGNELTFTATVTDPSSLRPDAASKLADKPRALPVLRLTFKDDALRQFIYASWRQFLDANSRKKKWTTGKKPEPIYPLLVNTLEPLVYFSSGAGDNLRAIRDLMRAVAAEAGSADLAAIELEIKQLDHEIDKRVYELYGLTDAEIKIVEGPDP